MLDRYDENLILGYIEDDLEAGERARFEAMLAQDEPLRLLIEQLIADRALLRAVPAKAAPAILMEQVQGELERQMLLDVAPGHVAPGRVAPGQVPSTRVTVGGNGTETNGHSPSASPVVYRFRHRFRWAGALAAALALAGGLTWHFDPLGWRQPVQPPIDVAIHQPDQDGKAGNDAAVLSADAMRHSAGGVDEADGKAGLHADPLASYTDDSSKDRQKPAKTAADLDRGGGQGGVDTATPVQGGKATAALAMAQDAVTPATPGTATPETLGGAETKDAKRGNDAGMAAASGLAAAGSVADTPAFQIELQTASAAQTRELLLAWADENDAVEASALELRRSRPMMRGLNGNGLEEQADEGVAADKSRQQKSMKDRAADPAAAAAGEKESIERANDQAQADHVDKAVARADDPQADPAGRSRGLVPADDAARPAAPAAPGSARHAPAAAAKAKAAAAPPSITLLIPEDRVDQLVEHIEAKTGQSLIVVREGGQTLLLSPQLANARSESRKLSEKQSLALQDAAPEASASPNADTPPQPSAEIAGKGAPLTAVAPPAPSKDSSPGAPAPPPTTAAPAVKPDQAADKPVTNTEALKTQAMKDVQERAKDEAGKEQAKKVATRQVKVRILLAEEPK